MHPTADRFVAAVPLFGRGLWATLASAPGWLLRRLQQCLQSSMEPLDDDEPGLPASIEPRLGPAPAASPAWQRFGQGMLDPLRVQPASADADGPGWQACIDRLHALREHWLAARAEREARWRRLLWLDLVLQLSDRGVVRALEDGSLPDVAALRTERLLLEVDQGPAVLAEVPELFARRIAFALQALPEASRTDALAQWQRLSELQALAAEERGLEARSQVVLALAWNDQADLDQVEVGYALAEEYRTALAGWLQRAAGVALAGGVRLDAFLLSRCDGASQDGETDAIGYVEAMRPLHVGMAALLRDSLDVLVALADSAERARPLAPPRLGQGSAA
ncbi:hypothetical protein [[Pseudomonas] boreopolis]|uniref:hypothetical protein n=1 Tax=Xanthomonas boreopolis TaxID=86183 RepID=UPI003D9BD11B